MITLTPVQQHAQLFKVLGHPTRLCILSLLRGQDSTLTVEDLQSRLTEMGIAIKQPVLSFHLKEMTQAGLIRYTHYSSWHYYAICPEIQHEATDAIRLYTGSVVSV